MTLIKELSGNLDHLRKRWDGRIPELRKELTNNPKLLVHQKVIDPHFQRLLKLAERLKAEFVGRDHAIEIFMACVVSGCPVVFLGPPGTAKSLLVRRTAQLCSTGSADGENNGYFEYLLSQFTMPEEIFGIADLKELRQGRFLRRTENRLPTAHFAFLDEIFRGSSQILNTLLTIINERKFHNGLHTLDVPLLAIVGAANQPPNSDDLAAFFDRFPIRIWVDSVLDDSVGHFAGNGMEAKPQRQRAESLLRASVEQDQRSAGYEKSPAVACLADLVVAQESLRAREAKALLQMGGEAADAFVEGFLYARKTLGLSDRSLATLLRVAVAREALFEGDNKPRQYLEVLAHAARSRSQQEDAWRRLESILVRRSHTTKA
jgi:MoxR-like ATPase